MNLQGINLSINLAIYNIARLLAVQFNGLCKWSVSAWVTNPYITMSPHTEHAHATFLHKYLLLQNLQTKKSCQCTLFFFFHSILHIKRTSAQHITRSYIYKIAFYASFPNGNFSGWLLFLSKLWHKVCHERKCTRPAQEWIMGVIIFLWIFSWSCGFSARLMLLRQRGSTTICSWRRRCG